MRQPPAALLQLCNGCANFAAFSAVAAAASLWTASGWGFAACGLGVALAYGLFAAIAPHGGRFADRVGRAAAAMLGGAVSASGCVIAATWMRPVPVLVGVALVVAGTGVYFPAAAALFSDADARHDAGRALHRKIGLYNVGSASGIVLGYAVAAALAHASRTAPLIAALGADLVLIAAMARFRRLPPRPPAAEGDRAAHPALPRLIVMSRISALAACVVGMGLLAHLEHALTDAHVAGDRVRRTASLVSGAFPAGYLGMFIALSRWGGWVLRPWRLWLLQGGLVVGAAGIVVAAATGGAPTAPLIAASWLIGTGFGAAYVGSQYYSLRLPTGAGRAAGLHETCVGAGNAGGPLVAGAAMALWTARFGPSSALLGLGVFLAVIAAATLAWQAAVIARIVADHPRAPGDETLGAAQAA